MKNIFTGIKEKLSSKVFISLNKTNNKKKGKALKITMLLLLPLSSIGLGVGLGIMDAKKSNSNVPSVSKQIVVDNQVARHIYLISSDNLSIPLTVNLDKRSTRQEELHQIFNCLKEGCAYQNSYLSGFINKDTVINKINLENDYLTIDVSTNILNSKFNLDKTLEALSRSFLQFDDVKKFKLTIEGRNLSDIEDINVSKNEYSSLDSINQVDTFYSSSIINKNKETVFYARNYENNISYLVPVSVYVDKNESLTSQFVNATRKVLPPSYNLKNVETYKKLDMIQDLGDYSFQVNETALNENRVVSSELFNLVSLSLSLNGVEKEVSFALNGENIAVDSKTTQNSQKVGSIIVNEVKI